MAWEIVKGAGAFCSIGEAVAATGMRALEAPCAGDGKIISGESGAAGLGTLTVLCTVPALEPVRRAMGLGVNSRCLCISTEGDTDPGTYQQIVQKGAYPLPYQ